MKRIIIIVNDSFDVGALISCAGTEVLEAHVVPHVPKALAPLGAHRETDHALLRHASMAAETEARTGRDTKEFTHLPGFTRESAPRNRVRGRSAGKLILDCLADGAWHPVGEIGDWLNVEYGYPRESGPKALSALKIAKQIERVGQGPNARYRIPRVLTPQQLEFAR